MQSAFLISPSGKSAWAKGGILQPNKCNFGMANPFRSLALLAVTQHESLLARQRKGRKLVGEDATKGLSYI